MRKPFLAKLNLFTPINPITSPQPRLKPSIHDTIRFESDSYKGLANLAINHNPRTGPTTGSSLWNPVVDFPDISELSKRGSQLNLETLIETGVSWKKIYNLESYNCTSAFAMMASDDHEQAMRSLMDYFLFQRSFPRTTTLALQHPLKELIQDTEITLDQLTIRLFDPEKINQYSLARAIEKICGLILSLTFLIKSGWESNELNALLDKSIDTMSGLHDRLITEFSNAFFPQSHQLLSSLHSQQKLLSSLSHHFRKRNKWLRPRLARIKHTIAKQSMDIQDIIQTTKNSDRILRESLRTGIEAAAFSRGQTKELIHIINEFPKADLPLIHFAFMGLSNRKRKRTFLYRTRDRYARSEGSSTTFFSELNRVFRLRRKFPNINEALGRFFTNVKSPHEIGILYEVIIAEQIQELGEIEIEALGYRLGNTEIDIVARQGNQLLYIEVKGALYLHNIDENIEQIETQYREACAAGARYIFISKPNSLLSALDTVFKRKGLDVKIVPDDQLTSILSQSD